MDVSAIQLLRLVMAGPAALIGGLDTAQINKQKICAKSLSLCFLIPAARFPPPSAVDTPLQCVTASSTRPSQ